MVRERSPRPALLNGLLGLLGVLIALGSIEIALRVAWQPLVQTPCVPSQGPDALPEVVSLFELGQPNVRGLNRGNYFRTNSAGFRGPEYAESPPAGTFRIVVVGDSFTMGWGVREEEAFPALLEAELNAQGGPTHYEVLNLGLAGLDISRVVDRLANIGLRFHPDLVVYGYVSNDILGPGYQSFTTGPFGALHRARYYRFRDSPFYLLRMLWPRWISLWEATARPLGSYEYEIYFNYFDNPRAWGDFADSMERLAAIANAHDICADILMTTDLSYLGLLPLLSIYERVAVAASERGVAVTQSFPLFRGKSASALTLSAVDAHPNAEGHRILARALVDGLSSLPARCWKSHAPPSAGSHW